MEPTGMARSSRTTSDSRDLSQSSRTVVIGLIILVALYRLTVSVTVSLLFGALDPLDPGVFQAVFGEILTLLIALEFNHTLQYVVRRDQSIIQTRSCS
jgi:uncharacterized membrane protein (DUF373 family)